MRVWVPEQVLAEELAELPDVQVDLYGGGPEAPSGVDEVEFYVPPFFPDRDSAEIAGAMPKLRVVQTLTAGVEKLRPYVPGSVALCNARGAHDASTAEWTVGAILAALHDFPRFAHAQQERTWAYQHTDSLAEKTVLIVGYGAIGAAVERRLAGFEVEVLRVARSPREGTASPVAAADELPGLLPRADVVVLLVPVTPDTRGMVDADFLARMKDGALLVNSARGVVVDTDALLAEARRGRVRAALDVTDPEPLPSDHPLWRTPGVFITPHVAGSTPVSARRSRRLVRDQLQRYVTGEPLHNVVSGPY
ncbi:MAG: phosphoglycerate dehydrogenase [Streptosporangiales bacterium]|nr:phosphoglycerate dehydrogenase [Streptosporangiales bacterium]